MKATNKRLERYRMKQSWVIIVICYWLISGCKKTADTLSTAELPDDPVPAADTETSSTKNFKGINWADERDNFTNDWLILSGFKVTDDESTMLKKTEKVITALQDAGVNTIRLPLNPPTVLQNFWPKYSSVISAISKKGMKVLLAYWEAASSLDGKVDDTAAFRTMWDRVVNKYKYNANVYFEIMNEPHGYSLNELKDLYAGWLSRYNIPRRRVILDGAGYATDVNSIGDDDRFDSCRLSFHYYTWFNNNYKTSADWELPIASLKYPERTITTEFGAPMTTGKNYQEAPGFDGEVAYIQGMTTQLHNSQVGSIYWPGIRANDTYAIFSYVGENISVNSSSGLKRLQYAWNIEDVMPVYVFFNTGKSYKIINRNSNKSLDVNNSSIENGAPIIQWEYRGSNNQLWTLQTTAGGYSTISNKNSLKLLDANDASVSAGSKIIQLDDSGKASQQWQVTDIGFGYYKIINRNSGLSLDINGGNTNNGADIIQWHWNRGANQQWLIAEP